MPTKEKIEARAYEIYLRRGSEDGDPLDDWLQAEQELAVEPDDPAPEETERSSAVAPVFEDSPRKSAKLQTK